MICEKDGREISWYHEHHLWPKYMDNPHGNSYPGFVSRIVLCKDHHLELHQEVITPTLQAFAKSKNKKEDLLWKQIPKEERRNCIRDVVLLTILWLQNERQPKD